MKRYLHVIILGMIVGQPVFAQSRILTITFHSPQKGGTILVAAYEVDATFMKSEQAIIRESVLFERDSTTISLVIPNNVVAISAFHDLDGDSQLDKSIIGIPTEPYGFSNDARGIFGPPEFVQCVLDLERTTQITIHLK